MTSKDDDVVYASTTTESVSSLIASQPTSASKLTSNCRILAAESYKCLETKPHSECSGNLICYYLSLISEVVTSL